MVKKIKVLFITTQFPYPLDNGGKIGAFNGINVVSKNNDITVLSFSEEPQFIQEGIDYYKKLGYPVYLNSEINEFEEFVSKKVIVLCGQTGSGKSTFINKMDSSLNLETNQISDALNRGKHTTRYGSLYKIKDYFIADTPGFSSLDLNELSIEEIKRGFVEFNNCDCKYQDCNHINTDGCGILPNVSKKILQSRYDNYTKIVREANESSRKFFKK